MYASSDAWGIQPHRAVTIFSWRLKYGMSLSRGIACPDLSRQHSSSTTRPATRCLPTILSMFSGFSFT